MDQAALLEPAEHAAQVAGIQAELTRELGGRGLGLVGELEEDSRLGKSELAARQSVPEDAYLLGVEAVETANAIDVADRIGQSHHGRYLP